MSFGALNAVQQIATALGVAVLGTVFFSSGAVAGALIVAASCVFCAVLFLALPTTERKTS